MNRNKAVTWLYDELPGLITAGVISEDTAERIRTHYGPVVAPHRGRVARMLFSIMGALLIGMGIILLLAHNWEDLSRPVRSLIAFTPLITGQLLVLWTLWRRNESLAWREGSATFLTLAIGACIALISQTYNLGGRLDSFLLTWMILAFPLIYFCNATTVAIMYFLGLTSWTISARFENSNMLFFWLLIALILPHIMQAYRRNPEGARLNLLAYGICFTLPISAGFVLDHAISGLWILVYSAMLSTFFLIGHNVFRTNQRNIFRITGFVGVALLAIILSFHEPWASIGWNRSYYQNDHPLWGPWIDGFIALFFMGLVIPLALRGFRQKNGPTIMVALFPLLSLISFALAAFECPIEMLLFFFNLYVFIYGIATLRAGLRRYELFTLNAGMGVISALLIARFFDTHLSFTLRGIIFILLGISFLVTNRILLQRIAARKEMAS